MKASAVLLVTTLVSQTALATTIQCRAESANVIAGLKSDSAIEFGTEALKLAQRAALIMCERQHFLHDSVTDKTIEMENATATEVSEKEQKEKSRSGFLGLSFDKAKRNDGHKRLQKKH